MIYMLAKMAGVIGLWSVALWWFFQWWTRRQYEDVTETYSRAVQRLEDRDALDNRESALMARLDQVRTRVDRLAEVSESPPRVNLDPVLERLAALEMSTAALPEQFPAEVDIGPLLVRLEALEGRTRAIPEHFSEGLSPVQARVAALEERLQLGPIESRLANVEAHLSALPTDTPDLAPVMASVAALRMPDMEPVEQRLALLEEYVTQLPTEFPEPPAPSAPVDLDPLNHRMRLLEERIEALSGPGLSGLTSSIAAVSGTVAALRMPDLGVVEQRMGAMEHQIGALATKMPEPVDIRPLHSRLVALEERLENLSGASLASLRSELNNVSTTLSALQMPDLSGVEQRIASVAGRIDALPAPRDVDLSPVAQRLTTLEAALHEIAVRVQGLGNTDLTPLELRLLELEEQVGRLPTQLDAPMTARWGSLEARLMGIETRVSQEIDFGPWTDRIMMMEARLTELASWDIRALDRKLAAVSSLIAAWGSPDLTSIEHRLSRIETKMGPVRTEAWLDTSTPAPAQTRVMAPPPPVRVAVVPDTPPPVPVRVAAPPPPAPKVKVVETVSTVEVIEQPSAEVEITDEQEGDPLDSVRRPGGGQNLLRFAAFGTPDDLKRISGVGPKLEAMLHDVGVYYFWQVSRWSDVDVEYVDSLLDVFKGRIERDEWVLQAMELAAEPQSAEPPDA